MLLLGRQKKSENCTGGRIPLGEQGTAQNLIKYKNSIQQYDLNRIKLNKIDN